MQNRTLAVPDVGTITYGISVPPGVKPGEARPLILALHPGGDRTAFYGSAFARQIVIPALGDLGAIVVAPDCPSRAARRRSFMFEHPFPRQARVRKALRGR